MTTLIWARRGLGFLVFALLVGFSISTAASSRPWLLEFDWAARFGAAYVFLLAPIVAAAVSYDIGQRARPEMALIGTTARRGAMALLSPAAAILAWSVVGAVVAWAMLALITATAGGLPPRDPWVFAETIASLSAAASLGMIVAVLVDGILAVAISAGLVLTTATLTSGQGANLFQVATSSGTMVGIERTPERAFATIACHVVIVAVACACLIARQHAHPLSRRRLGVASFAVSLPIAAAMVWPYSASEYRPSEEARACVGSTVKVCGPRSASPLLKTAAMDLNEATRRLRPSGLPLPEQYVIARGSAADTLAQDQTLLDLDSSQLIEGHLPTSTLASAVSTPRLCRGFYSNQEAPALIEHVRIVSTWAAEALTESGPVSVAPTAVREAYAALTTCATK